MTRRSSGARQWQSSSTETVVGPQPTNLDPTTESPAGETGKVTSGLPGLTRLPRPDVHQSRTLQPEDCLTPLSKARAKLSLGRPTLEPSLAVILIGPAGASGRMANKKRPSDAPRPSASGPAYSGLATVSRWPNTYLRGWAPSTEPQTMTNRAIPVGVALSLGGAVARPANGPRPSSLEPEAVARSTTMAPPSRRNDTVPWAVATSWSSPAVGLGNVVVSAGGPFCATIRTAASSPTEMSARPGISQPRQSKPSGSSFLVIVPRR